jgi:hypothetical protein
MKGKLISEDAQRTFAVILNTTTSPSTASPLSPKSTGSRPASSPGSVRSAIACSATSTGR